MPLQGDQPYRAFMILSRGSGIQSIYAAPGGSGINGIFPFPRGSKASRFLPLDLKFQQKGDLKILYLVNKHDPPPFSVC